MTDEELLTLCAFQEADAETDEGVAAVVRVILNRTRLGYNSDRTIRGTILRHEQFSWTEFAMVGGRYREVALGLQAELVRVQHLLTLDEAQLTQWARCARIAVAVGAGDFSGPLYNQLTDQTVLYANLSISRPAWLSQSHLVVKIDHQSFFVPLGFPAIDQRVAANDVDQFKTAIGDT